MTNNDSVIQITAVLYSALSRSLLRSAPSPTSVKQCGITTREK